MDYLHCRYRRMEPFEYMRWSHAKKIVAKAYKEKEMEDRRAELNEKLNALGTMFGGGGN